MTPMMRILLVVGLMMAPMLAVAAAKSGVSPKVSGAGLVLIVSVERNR
jgi:hypothetical protein